MCQVLQGSEQAPGPLQPKQKQRRVQFKGFLRIPDSPPPTTSPVDERGGPIALDGQPAAEGVGAGDPHNPLDPHTQAAAATAGDVLFGGSSEHKPLKGVRYCFLGFKKDDPVSLLFNECLFSGASSARHQRQQCT